MENEVFSSHVLVCPCSFFLTYAGQLTPNTATKVEMISFMFENSIENYGDLIDVEKLGVLIHEKKIRLGDMNLDTIMWKRTRIDIQIMVIYRVFNMGPLFGMSKTGELCSVKWGVTDSSYPETMKAEEIKLLLENDELSFTERRKRKETWRGAESIAPEPVAKKSATPYQYIPKPVTEETELW